MQLSAPRIARPRLTSLAGVAALVDEFLADYAPSRPTNDVIEPLDGLLVYLMLDLFPSPPVVVDATAGTTHGVVTALGLSHPLLRQVVTIQRDGLGKDELAEALQRYDQDRRERGPELVIARPTVVQPEHSSRHPLLVVLDAYGTPTDHLQQEVERWLAAADDVIVLVLGVGLVGESAALANLVRALPPDGPRRLWLARELTDALAASRIALMARSDHPYAADLLTRLTQLYAGNFRYLDLLWQQNLGAMQAADVNREAVLTHPGSAPFLKEYNDAKREAEEGRNRATALSDQLGALQRDSENWKREAEELRAAVREARQTVGAYEAELHRLHNTLAFRTGMRLSRFRTRMAPFGSLRYRLYHATLKAARGAGSLLRLGSKSR